MYLQLMHNCRKVQLLRAQDRDLFALYGREGSDLQNEQLTANKNGRGTVVSREARRKGVVRFAPKGYHRRRSTDAIPLREKEGGRKRRPLSNISNVVENREPLTKSTKTRRIECPAAEPHAVEGSILAAPAISNMDRRTQLQVLIENAGIEVPRCVKLGNVIFDRKPLKHLECSRKRQFDEAIQAGVKSIATSMCPGDPDGRMQRAFAILQRRLRRSKN
jgi:hypothetical protein